MSTPVIILVNPQLGENIGACARAMLNCNLTELRLVKPRDGWPSESALANASGADKVIETAKLYETTQQAIADLELVYATSARQFTLNKPIDNLEQAAETLAGSDLKTGILFGPERTGLHGDDVALAGRILTIPLNPTFSSLNIAQAVLLVAYGWHRAQGLAQPAPAPRVERQKPATQEQFEGLIDHVVRELDAAEFFTSPAKRPSMVRNLRAAFARMQPTEQDVQTFRGIVKALVLGRRGGQR